MIPRLPTRRMREHADLHQLKLQAKELLTRFRAGTPKAVTEVNTHYERADAATFALHDAQLVIARSYGFDSWPKLKAYVDGITIRRLVEAVQSGDLERVRAMLQTRPELADMQVSYGDEHRAIHYAVMHRQPGIARLLMRKGANARAGIHPHRSATSAWTLASERGYTEIVAILEEEERRRKPTATVGEPEPTYADETLRSAVANGDNALLEALRTQGHLHNPVRWNGGGLLTVAVENDHMDVLRFLLDCGFDPNERVSSGQGDWIAWSQGYPLWHCAALGRRDMAELLLDRGADPNVHVDSSGSAVHSAYSHRQWDMAALLESRGGVLTHDTAALYRRTDVIRAMLPAASQAVLEETVRFAADSGATEIVSLAMARVGWPRNDERWFRILSSPLTFWHHIPWLYAGNKDFDRDGYLECFRLILQACDAATVTGGFGRTILHEVAAMGDWITDDEVRAFGEAALSAGATHHRRDAILNSTPLGWACRWGRPTLVTLLLDRGADPREPEAEPWATPLAWARKRGHLGIVTLLEAAIAS